MNGEFKFDFENLKVYQKSLEFIDEIFKVYKGLDKEYKYSVGSNLLIDEKAYSKIRVNTREITSMLRGLTDAQ